MQIYRLENVVQPYVWGSKSAIADLLGEPVPAAEPQAELWMGTHPKGSSRVVTPQGRIPLQQLIDQQPVEILGHDVFARFGNALPYLFKVLAAARPLSIQAHPDQHQAEEGFLRESRDKKALDAPDRNYRDGNHKPEIICALTPFWGMNGFRSATAAAELLAPVCPQVLEDAFQALKRPRGDALKFFFKAMLLLAVDRRRKAVREIREKAEPRADRSPVYRWMVELARHYPEDMGVLSPALLNLICLQPDQAMFLPAGQLHAYLEGVGIELMANSDNVLRGGLTRKHVDVRELLRVVRFVETPVQILDPRPVGPMEFCWDCPAEEFSLSVIRPETGQPYIACSVPSVQMLLCTAGEGWLEGGSGERIHSIKKGQSYLVPAGSGSYVIHGDLTVFKAAVPPAHPG